jgi:hypothetical protein
MNKFEALKQFQAWPPEYQRLCAEYWIETGEDRAAVKLPMYDDPIPRPVYQPKAAAKVAAKPKRTKYTLQELDFLDNLIYSELGPTLAVKNFCKRFPNSGHPKESLTTKFHKRRQDLRNKGELA